MAGDLAEAAVGERINRLAMSFDFERPQRAGRFAGDVIVRMTRIRRSRNRRGVKPEKCTDRRSCWWTTTPRTFRSSIRRSRATATACSPREAARTRSRSPNAPCPDLILLDVMMPEMDGFETCARLKADARTRDSAVIFLSALTEPSEKVRGLELGAVDFVNKPFQAEEVLARVRTHLTIRDLQKQLRRRNEELEHELTVAQELLREASDRTDGVLLGDSAVAVRLRHDIQDAAESDDTLLISGPPGSDHEAVARAVHHQSRRAARAIICVNCLSVVPDCLAIVHEDRSGARTFSTSCAWPTAARCIWKASSICPGNRSGCSPSGCAPWTRRAAPRANRRPTCA